MAHVLGESGAHNHSVIRSITNSGSERMWSESDWKSARCGAAAEVMGAKEEVVEDGVEGARGENLRANIVQVSSGEREGARANYMAFPLRRGEVTGDKDVMVRCRGEMPGAPVLRGVRGGKGRHEATWSLTMNERLPWFGP